jgi:hypothetical protein
MTTALARLMLAQMAQKPSPRLPGSDRPGPFGTSNVTLRAVSAAPTAAYTELLCLLARGCGWLWPNARTKWHASVNNASEASLNLCERNQYIANTPSRHPPNPSKKPNAIEAPKQTTPVLRGEGTQPSFAAREPIIVTDLNAADHPARIGPKGHWRSKCGGGRILAECTASMSANVEASPVDHRHETLRHSRQIGGARRRGQGRHKNGRSRPVCRHAARHRRPVSCGERP